MITAELPDEFAVRYAAALLDHLVADDPEDSLTAAYSLGREAVDTGLGVLELTSIHQQALNQPLPGELEDSARTWERAHAFFQESLAPFEMVLRGFREANASLREANETLERYAADLAGANKALEWERATLAGLSGMSDGVLLIDAGGEVRYCNARAGELLGVTTEDTIGQSVEAFMASAAALPDDFGHWLDEQEQRSSIEINQVGSPPCDLLIQVFPVANHAAAARGLVVRDVTAERDLARAKAELAAIVSHELRNPLSVILGFADLLISQPFDDETHEENLRMIASEARRLTALVDDFLDLQRLELGQMSLSCEPTDLRALLEQAVATFSPDATHPLVSDVPANLPELSADPKRVLQVLVNLLSNARKYSPNGGELRVSARALDTFVEVCVADNGLGLSPEVLPRLFEKFFRVDDPERWGIEGTGLGLAICREIVEAHGGTIWATSDGPGRGSRFCFTLPQNVVRP